MKANKIVNVMNITSENLSQIIGIVGYYSVNWSLMERQMDNIIHYVQDGLGGVEGFRNRPFTSFIRKCNYLELAFKSKLQLAAYSYEGLRLLNGAKDFSRLRHVMIHGAPESIVGTVIIFNKLQDGPNYKSILYRYDVMSFEKDSINCGQLVSDWLAMSDALVREWKNDDICP